ncbi:MAG: ATP-binding protein [Ruminococcus sp.]|nr:ATP-binding protein [Ruminococcus sp.]
MTLLEEIGYGLDALVIFRQLRQDSVLTALSKLCHCHADDTTEKIRAYSDMTAALYTQTDSLTEYIEQLVLASENVYVQRIGAKQPITKLLTDCLHSELKILGKIAQLTPATLQVELQLPIPMPTWNIDVIDLDKRYSKRLSEIEYHGYGIYAKYHMFTLNNCGEVIPVHNPDPIQLCDMVGYQRERQVVVDNTCALLRGRYASNVLLSGDAGTGKSATIKAIANTYREQGLRLIELNKEQLKFIQKLMDHLCQNPLKFILFIDDLTFSEDDPNFGTLKAILEGSTTARLKNTVIYATSNRRHLIKETFDDGRDKHHNDTVQERISLSARFGITVTFTRPEKKLYLEIVHALAKESGLTLPEIELDAQAEQFAMQKIGRSARTARQFIDQLTAKEQG